MQATLKFFDLERAYNEYVHEITFESIVEHFESPKEALDYQLYWEEENSYAEPDFEVMYERMISDRAASENIPDYAR